MELQPRASALLLQVHWTSAILFVVKEESRTSFLVVVSEVVLLVVPSWSINYSSLFSISISIRSIVRACRPAPTVAFFHSWWCSSILIVFVTSIVVGSMNMNITFSATDVEVGIATGVVLSVPALTSRSRFISEVV